MKTIIKFENMNFGYNNTNSFTGFSMEIEEEDIITMIGTPGSGKTTLLKMICKQLPNDYLYYKDRNISSYDNTTLQKEIVVIFDLPFKKNTVREELEYFLNKIGYSKESNVRIKEISKQFELDTLLDVELKELSYEEKYLIKILRYLIIKPRFIAIDNILSVLDKHYKKSIFTFIKKNKITLLNVTTDLEDSLYGNKIFILENFVLILEGPTLKVLQSDNLLKRFGFRLPLPIDLSIELNHYELLNKIYTDSEKLVGALWK